MESETQPQLSVLCNFTVEFTCVSLLQQHCIHLSLSKAQKRTSKFRQQMDFSELGKHNHCSNPLLKKVVFKDLSMTEKEMATHSRSLAWEIPWTEEPLTGYSEWSHKKGGQDLVTKQQQYIHAHAQLCCSGKKNLSMKLLL